MPNSRFANEFAVTALPTLHHWFAQDLQYEPRCGVPVPIRGMLDGKIQTRILDSDGHRREVESRMMQLFTEPTSPEYCGIDSVEEEGAIIETRSEKGIRWTIESVNRPRDHVLIVQLVGADRTDLTAPERYRT